MLLRCIPVTSENQFHCTILYICTKVQWYIYCNFTNLRCVKISVTSDHGAFGEV